MKAIRVIAPGGATIRGPAVIGLSPDQWKRRAAILGKQSRKNRYELPGGAEIMLKCGEVFGMDGVERLNKALFEEIAAEPDAETDAKAKAEAEAKAQAEAAAAERGAAT